MDTHIQRARAKVSERDRKRERREREREEKEMDTKEIRNRSNVPLTTRLDNGGGTGHIPNGFDRKAGLFEAGDRQVGTSLPGNYWVQAKVAPSSSNTASNTMTIATQDSDTGTGASCKATTANGMPTTSTQKSTNDAEPVNTYVAITATGYHVTMKDHVVPIGDDLEPY